jgi:uncharacterized protein (TIGR03083 family)
MTMTSSHVRRTTRDCVGFLRASLDGDWNASVPGLDFSITGVVAHVAETCLWYAIDLAAAGNNLASVEHRVKTDTSPADVVDTLAAYAEVIAAVIEATPNTARGFHPFGMADPSGFAAMACDEMLIHTDDAARGLGRAFHPDPDLAAAVLHRLFPWVSNVTDPWEQLRWANGRTDFADRPRLSGWAWHCAPLEEWDGTVTTKTRRC